MRMVRFFAGFLLAMLATAPAAYAQALFKFTGDYTAIFSIPVSPVPDDSVNGGFVIYDVDGFPNTANGYADVTFYSSGANGGLNFMDYYGNSNILRAEGAQLYTGSTASPTFANGTYSLVQSNGGPGRYTLTISGAVGGAPEPGTWAMMIVGFGLAGYALRRNAARQRPNRAALAISAA